MKLEVWDKKLVSCLEEKQRLLRGRKTAISVRSCRWLGVWQEKTSYNQIQCFSAATRPWSIPLFSSWLQLCSRDRRVPQTCRKIEPASLASLRICSLVWKLWICATNGRRGLSHLLWEMATLWALSRDGGEGQASTPQISLRNTFMKAVGCKPSTFAGKPIIAVQNAEKLLLNFCPMTRTQKNCLPQL